MLSARMALFPIFSCKKISLNPQKDLVRSVLLVITTTQTGTAVCTGSQGWHWQDCGRGSRQWTTVVTMEKQKTEAPLHVQVTSNQEVKAGWKRARPSNDFYKFSKVTIRLPLLKRVIFSAEGILWPVLIHKIYSLLIPWAEGPTSVYSGAATAVAGVPGFMHSLRWGRLHSDGRRYQKMQNSDWSV